jgi:LmbE family N-acetylglucosaminyl deacetylase
MNPYHKFVSDYTRLMTDGKALPLGGLAPQPQPKPAPGAPTALIFSPHPDDECIIGGLALRWLREAGWRIINVAVTQGSARDRQQGRLAELRDACQWLGFGLEQTAPNGLERITPKARAAEPAHWAAAVPIIAAALAAHQPRAILFPHEFDWNGTHIGTHHLVMDALKTLPAAFQTCLVETEFWGQMMSPNLMVEISATDLGEMLSALSYHVGEVKRNPYHLRLPAWMQDNVRRGAELVGGQGGAAPNYMFATLYRLRQWQGGGVRDMYSGGRQIGAGENSGQVFDALCAQASGPAKPTA